jgi:hypothetical protein
MEQASLLRLEDLHACSAINRKWVRDVPLQRISLPLSLITR